jgi:hypothetical protein
MAYKPFKEMWDQLPLHLCNTSVQNVQELCCHAHAGQLLRVWHSKRPHFMTASCSTVSAHRSPQLTPSQRRKQLRVLHVTKSPTKLVAPLPNLKFRYHSKNTLNYSDDIEVLKAIEGFICFKELQFATIWKG